MHPRSQFVGAARHRFAVPTAQLGRSTLDAKVRLMGMNLSGMLAALLLGAAICTACSDGGTRCEARSVDVRVAIPHLREQPAPRLRVRRADYAKFPREGFGVVFTTAGGFALDTFAGRVTKDLVLGPDTTVALCLSDAELDAIYKKAIEIRFFDYPEPRPAMEVRGHLSWNEGVTSLSITAGTITRTLSWNGGDVPGGANLDDWKRLFELVLLIRDTVERRPEYRALPEPRGVY